MSYYQSLVDDKINDLVEDIACLMGEFVECDKELVRDTVRFLNSDTVKYLEKYAGKNDVGSDWVEIIRKENLTRLRGILECHR